MSIDLRRADPARDDARCRLPVDRPRVRHRLILLTAASLHDTAMCAQVPAATAWALDNALSTVPAPSATLNRNAPVLLRARKNGRLAEPLASNSAASGVLTQALLLRYQKLTLPREPMAESTSSDVSIAEIAAAVVLAGMSAPRHT